MIDLQPCLSGCDRALAETDTLLSRLTDLPPEMTPELDLARLQVAALRREVERLRGMATVEPLVRVHPDRMKSPSKTPWSAEEA